MGEHSVWQQGLKKKIDSYWARCDKEAEASPLFWQRKNELQLAEGTEGGPTLDALLACCKELPKWRSIDGLRPGACKSWDDAIAKYLKGENGVQSLLRQTAALNAETVVAQRDELLELGTKLTELANLSPAADLEDMKTELRNCVEELDMVSGISSLKMEMELELTEEDGAQLQKIAAMFDRCKGQTWTDSDRDALAAFKVKLYAATARTMIVLKDDNEEQTLFMLTAAKIMQAVHDLLGDKVCEHGFSHFKSVMQFRQNVKDLNNWEASKDQVQALEEVFKKWNNLHKEITDTRMLIVEPAITEYQINNAKVVMEALVSNNSSSLQQVRARITSLYLEATRFTVSFIFFPMLSGQCTNWYSYSLQVFYNSCKLSYNCLKVF